MRMDFNQDSSITALSRAQTRLHECVTTAFAFRIYDSIRPGDREKMELRRNVGVPERVPIFGPDTIVAPPRISDPDLQLVFEEPGSASSKTSLRPTLAVEVAGAQSSDELELRARELLRETSARVVIAIDIKEHPKYDNPLEESKKFVKLDQFCQALRHGSDRWEGELLQDLAELADERVPYSPTFIRGLRWVGELTGIIQVFAKDSKTGAIVARTKKLVGSECLIYMRRESALTDPRASWADRKHSIDSGSGA